MADTPVLLTVEDDPDVSRVIARELRARLSPEDTRFPVRPPLSRSGS